MGRYHLPFSDGERHRLWAHLERLEGWCTREKAIRLAELVVEAHAARSVDLGVFGGRSWQALAFGHQHQAHGFVLGVDPYTVAATAEGTNDLENKEWWAALDLEKMYLDAVWTFLPNAHAELLRTTSITGAGFFRDGEVDLLHQDSNHSEEVSCAELDAWWPKLRPGGVWVMDDTNWPSLQEAQRRVLALGATLEEDYDQWRVYRRPA